MDIHRRSVVCGQSSVILLMQTLKSVFLLFKDALLEFFKDRASIYAAGLAYYTVFSIVPLLVFIISIAGFFIDRNLASEQVLLQLQYLVGNELAGFIEGAMTALRDQATSRTATLLSIAALFIGATGIFRQLKTALNLVWGISDVRPANAREWLLLARYRAIPFLMVFLLGFMLSVAVVFEAVLGAVRARFEVLFPDAGAFLPQLGRLVIPALTLTMFLFVFKALPDAYVRWRDAAVGAAVTTVLFLMGRVMLSVFLSFSNTGSIFGAAGSVIILLFWIYYSAQILIYGAEFTWLYALRHGQPIRPKRLSRMIEGEEPATHS